MPTYDRPQTERYTFSAIGFGGTTTSKEFQGPPGKKGLVRDIMVYLSIAAVGTTTVPEIDVGTAASDSSFARFLLGTTLILGYAIGEYRARTLCQNAQGRLGSYPFQLTDFANHACLEGNNASIPANGPGTCSLATPAASLITVGGLTQTTLFTFIPADSKFWITCLAGVGGSPAGTGDVVVDIDWF
jgi:hypothetical protein